MPSGQIAAIEALWKSDLCSHTLEGYWWNLPWVPKTDSRDLDVTVYDTVHGQCTPYRSGLKVRHHGVLPIEAVDQVHGFLRIIGQLKEIAVLRGDVSGGQYRFG